MSFALLLTYAMTIATLAAKPGPGVVAVVSRTLARGKIGFITYMSGAVLGELVFLGIVALGIVVLDDELLFISFLLKALASVYLIYLGIKALLQQEEIKLGKEEPSEAQNNWNDFSTGLMLTLSNPFVIIVFGGLIPGMIGDQGMTLSLFLVLAAITAIVQVSIDFLYCLPAMISRKFVTTNTLSKLRVAAGIAMILIGLYLGYSMLFAQDLKQLLP
ncbi:MAG: LysE family translocator [Alphaproteobacteria bacterium]|nr:LysE family translocator [Alphaproteobacteria bacterium]